MKRRRENQRNPWRHVADEAPDAMWVVFVVITAITAFFGSMLYGGLTSDQNNVRESQVGYVRIMQAADYGSDEDAKSRVKVIATSILISRQQGSELYGLDEDARFADAVTRAAQTGVVPSVTMPKATWGKFLWVWVPTWLGLMTHMFFVGVNLCYARRTLDRKEYLADLKWPTIGTISFALCSVMLWPAFIVSGIRMVRNAERDAAEAKQRAAEEAKRKAAKKKPPVQTFEANHAGALVAYGVARNATVVGNLERKEADLTEEAADLVTEGNNLGERLREIQHRRIVARSTLAEVRKLREGPAITVSDEQIEAEFKRLIAFQGVKYVRPEGDDGLKMLVMARLEHEGVLYDLGDWELSVTRTGIQATEIRRGVRDDWGMYRYPSYRYTNGDFCFGDQMQKLRDHAVKGEILEAVSQAVRCLCSVSEEHEGDIPNAFKVIGEESE